MNESNCKCRGDDRILINVVNERTCFVTYLIRTHRDSVADDFISSLRILLRIMNE